MAPLNNQTKQRTHTRQSRARRRAHLAGEKRGKVRCRTTRMRVVCVACGVCGLHTNGVLAHTTRNVCACVSCPCHHSTTRKHTHSLTFQRKSNQSLTLAMGEEKQKEQIGETSVRVWLISAKQKQKKTHSSRQWFARISRVRVAPSLFAAPRKGVTQIFLLLSWPF